MLEFVIERGENMNILVIGNGFDLAHELPTKYTDFLEVCRMIQSIYNIKNMKKEVEQHWEELNIRVSYRREELQELFKELCQQRKIKQKINEDGEIVKEYIITNTKWDEFGECMGVPFSTNHWEAIFRIKLNQLKGNWIDFEKEISLVIRGIEKEMWNVGGCEDMLDIKVTQLSEAYLAQRYIRYYSADKEATFRIVKSDLLMDLNRLTRALEIYLCEFISKINIKISVPDISELEIDHVLSFNYTDTYQKVYDNTGKQIVEYDCIHGKADINNTIDTNNMVLGIDEYLSDEKKDVNVEFIEFKKFYQRIFKGNIQNAKDWCGEIKREDEYEKNSRKFMLEEQIKYELISDENELTYTWQDMEDMSRMYEDDYRKVHQKHNVYIFGHSLDVTDKDILRDLILNDNVCTTIFYYSKDGIEKRELGGKIANLTRIIGEDELIKRTAGQSKTILFKMQREPIRIK